MKSKMVFSTYLIALMTVLITMFSLVWVYTIYCRPNFLSKGYGEWRAVIKNIHTCHTSDIAILGSSQASVGFLPREMRIPATNYGLLASSPIEAYFEARDLLQCPAPPKVFIISLGGFDFVSHQWFWERDAPYGLLDYNDLQDVARSAAALGPNDLYHSSFGSEPPPAMKNWLYTAYFPSYDFASLIASHGGNRRALNDKYTTETLANDGEHLFNDGDACAESPSWEAGRNSFQSDSVNKYYFERLLRLLTINKKRVLFVSPPMSNLTYNGMRASYAQAYSSFIRNELKPYPNVYFTGPVFRIMDKCLYIDSWHLNRKGVNAFSNSMGQVISQI